MQSCREAAVAAPKMIDLLKRFFDA